MESIVFFGKGGIGKSTIASNITVLLAAGGRKVLHAGCDPKMDSTLSLMGRHIQPFTVKSGNSGQAGLRESIHASRISGVHCIEAGGPQPGVGCAGTGIGSMLDAMKDGSLLEKDGYTAAVFDVLGDVVCGGFAAPLRRGFAKKAVIVTSEEPLSLFAANRLIIMIDSYARNGVYLAGLAVNAKTSDGAMLEEDFARGVITRVLGVVLRDPAVTAAEREHRPAVIAQPKSDFTRRAIRLCAAIKTAGPPASAPRAMPDADFFAFVEGRHSGTAARAGRPAKQAPADAPNTPRARRPAALIFEKAGFIPSGMEGGQLLCDWRSAGGVLKVVIAPASAAQKGTISFSDWAVCLHPSVGKDCAASGSELQQAAAPLASLRFEEMLADFMGMKDFYGGLTTYSIPEERTPAGEDISQRSHIGFGQWHRFIFTDGGQTAFIPPGAVLVEHGDSECRFCGAEGGALGMFNINSGLKKGLQTRGPLLPRADQRIVNTDFQASDAVFGDEAKMQRSLSDAAAQAGQGGLIEFYVGCSPMMLASDAASFSGRVERETGVRVVLENYNSFDEHSPKKTAVRADFMAGRLSRARGKATRDVNLVGFGQAGEELALLLAERGLSATGPAEEFYSGARSARLQVLAGRDAVLGAAFEKAGMNWLLPPAPYGFSGTDRWLAAIAGALGKNRIKTGPSAAQKAESLKLFRLARGHEAGFVASPDEFPLLSGNTALKPVPALPVLAEAGFKLRLFIMTGGFSAREAGAGFSALRATQPGRRLSAAFFKTPEELNSLLRKDRRLRLVYSDIYRDTRLVSAGKNPFSTALFQPGYAGALETWRRLLELCEWDFNERYFLQD
jgi:nitrogenase iron protein NifH